MDQLKLVFWLLVCVSPIHVFPIQRVLKDCDMHKHNLYISTPT